MKLNKVTDTYSFMPQALLEVRLQDDAAMLQIRTMNLEERTVLAYGTLERTVEDIEYAVKVLNKIKTQAQKRLDKLAKEAAEAKESTDDSSD